MIVRTLKILVASSYALYAASLLGLWLLWSQFGERHWLLIGLCYAPPRLYAVPLLPLFGAALLLREKRLLLPSLLLAVAVLMGPSISGCPARELPPALAP